MGNMESGTIIPVSAPASAYDGLAKSFGSFADSLMTQAANKKKLDAAEMLQARAEVKRVEENAPIVARAAKVDKEVAANDAFVTKAGANTVDDILKGGMSAGDKTKHVYGSLYSSVNGVTLENAASVKDTLSRNADLLSPDQQESLWTAYDNNVSTLAKGFNTEGNDINNNVFSSPAYRDDLVKINEKANKTISETPYMQMKNSAMTTIDDIKNSKTLNDAEKNLQIASVQNKLKTYVDVNQDAIATTEGNIELDRTNELKTLDKSYESNYNSLLKLLSPSAQRKMKTFVDEEVKKRDDVQTEVRKADQGIYEEHVSSLTGSLVNASGTSIINSKDKFKHAMLATYNAARKEEAVKYGNKYKGDVNLAAMEKDYFAGETRIDYSKAFQDYKKSRNGVVKTNQDIISKNLSIESQRVAAKNKAEQSGNMSGDEKFTDLNAMIQFANENGIAPSKYMVGGSPSRKMLEMLIGQVKGDHVKAKDAFDLTAGTVTKSILTYGDMSNVKIGDAMSKVADTLPTEYAKTLLYNKMNAWMSKHKSNTAASGVGENTVNEEDFNERLNFFSKEIMAPYEKKLADEKKEKVIETLRKGYETTYNSYAKDGIIDAKERKTLDVLAAHAMKHYNTTFDK